MRRRTKRKIIIVSAAILFLISLTLFFTKPKPKIFIQEIIFPSPDFVFQRELFSYQEPANQDFQYLLPLKELPDNYQDLEAKLKRTLTEEQKQVLLDNGALILEGDGFENFNDAYQYLAKADIPIFITSDYILHFLRIQFSEVLKNLEKEKISPISEKFLKEVLKETEKQYIGFGERGINAELAKRNTLFLSVALSLFNPDFVLPELVKKEADSEVSKIISAKGVLLSEVFSQDCPDVCLDLIIDKDNNCSSVKSGILVPYGEKTMDSLEFYQNFCSDKCYCEDYSHYAPVGYYTLSEELKRYYRAATYLKRATFGLKSEIWTKQAILLTLAVDKAKVWREGRDEEAKNLWKKLYSVVQFFDGEPKTLNFYDYSRALNQIMIEQVIERPEQVDVGKINFDQFRLILGTLKGEEIFNDFEIDLTGNLREVKNGLTLMPSVSLLESHIFQELTYKNVGPNPQAEEFREVRGFMRLWEAFDCEDMKIDRFEKNWSYGQYWKEICKSALDVYELRPLNFYSVCKMTPSGLELVYSLGFFKSEEILQKFYPFSSFCEFDTQKNQLRQNISLIGQERWANNLNNLWLWQLLPSLKESRQISPSWLSSETHQIKNIITLLAVFSQANYKPIMYLEEVYEPAGDAEKREIKEGALVKYSGYLEPNLELYTKIHYTLNLLIKGLQEQGLMTGKVFLSLNKTLDIIESLKKISEKNLKNISLEQSENNFIKNLPEKFKDAISDLAGVYMFAEGTPRPDSVRRVYLRGEEDAFKSSFVRSVFEEEYSKRVFQTATGNLDWILLIHKLGDGKIISAGPIFSYYEFFWPLGDELTDKRWRDHILKITERPIWYSELKIPSSSKIYLIK